MIALGLAQVALGLALLGKSLRWTKGLSDLKVRCADYFIDVIMAYRLPCPSVERFI